MMRSKALMVGGLGLAVGCGGSGSDDGLPEAIFVPGAADGAGDDDDDNPGDDDDDNPGDDDDDSSDTGSPEPDGAGPADYPQGRRIRRLTADQYSAALEVATGQSWPDYPQYAATLGKASFSDITEHDRSLSVTFDKFTHDAALYACRAAVDGDADEGTTVILRHVTLDEQDPAAVRDNIAYLLLRFLAVDAGPLDDRVAPFADLVLAPAEGDMNEELLRERWTAVCLALATHPDFVTY